MGKTFKHRNIRHRWNLEGVGIFEVQLAAITEVAASRYAKARRRRKGRLGGGGKPVSGNIGGDDGRVLEGNGILLHQRGVQVQRHFIALPSHNSEL